MRHLWLAFSFCLYISSGFANTKPIDQPKIKIPLWTMILNMHDKSELPYRFRTSWGDVPKSDDSTNLSRLKVIGSAQFSEQQFKNAVLFLNKFGVSPDRLVVVDLREEPHAFVNGLAFHWYARNAWWTQSAPVAYVVEAEKERLNQLTPGETISLKGIEGKDKAGNVTRLKEFQITIHSLKTEEQVVTESGAHYVRIAVTDHMRPEDKDVDQFLDLIQTLPPEVCIYVHCHAGHGRTSTFMIMYDIIRNPALPLHAIIDRQVQLGSIDVRKLSNPLKNHKHPNERFRMQFIHKFYHYVNAPDGLGKMSWTNWVTKHFKRMDDKDEESIIGGHQGMVASTR